MKQQKIEYFDNRIADYIARARVIVQKDLNSKAGNDFYYEQVIEVAKMIQKEELSYYNQP